MADRDGQGAGLPPPVAARGRARAAAWAQGFSARARQAGLVPPFAFGAILSPLAVILQGWGSAEAGPGRLILWCAVAFGAGIVIYFAAGTEPSLWAALTLCAVCCVFTVTLRNRPIGFAAAALLAMASAGFAAATLRTALVAHPVLDRPLFGAAVTGWVIQREQRERTDRIVIAVDRITAPRFEGTLAQVRVSVRKGTAPPVGAYVSMKARLSPPTGPLRPGGYDFARDLYFQEIAATGFALGRIERVDPANAPPSATPWRMRFVSWVAQVRDAIDVRIRAAVTGDAGAIASALITGKRDAISTPVNEAMFVSSLGHILSISGYHMAVVAGVVFFMVRGLLALFAPLAMRYPIKKWAAVVALVAATGYLVLSGAAIATQRAYMMTAIVLIGVLIDRPALTLRTLAVAALALMALSPEMLIHPSFQMSFAATLALIAVYERGLPWMIAGADTSLGARVALWGGRELLATVMASLVAGTATTLYAAYHFHRLAPYGVLANLLAMPVVSIWVMPVGLLGLILVPFGFDAPLWRLMGAGVDWMIAVAEWVAALPGAVGRIAAFGPRPLLIATAGLLIVCLLRTPLRWSGVLLAAIAIAAAVRTPLPDVLVAPEANVVGVRGADGRLSLLKIGSSDFAMRHWLAADGDARTPGDRELAAGFTCDEIGCTARLADGALVAVVFEAEAFGEDCKLAALVISRRTAPPHCAAQVIDRSLWPQSGALALKRTGYGFDLTAARPKGSDRPWAPAPQERRSATPPAQAGTVQRSPADATPAENDLAPDD